MTHKRGTRSTFVEMESLGVDINLIQNGIDNMIRLALLSIGQQYIDDYRTTIKTQNDRCRLFEILGVDIFIDEFLKPWLIEANKNPSLKTKSDFDFSIKSSMVKGALKH
jgi:tubulin polyglutamylase TTLL6/13